MTTKQKWAALAKSVHPAKLTREQQTEIYDRTMRGEEPWQQ